MVIRKLLSATAGRRSRRVNDSAKSARVSRPRACAGSERTSRRIRGVLPSSTSIGMSTGVWLQQRIADLQLAVAGDRRRPRRTGSARARRARRSVDAARRERQHVALLRLVAPDFHRRQFRLGARHRAQVDAPAALAVRDRLGQCIRQTARTDVVDQQDRVRRRPSPSSHRSPLARGAGSRDCRAAPRRNPGPTYFGRCPRDEAAPPPRPISIAGPAQHHQRRARPPRHFFSTWPRRTLPSPPAIMMGL